MTTLKHCSKRTSSLIRTAPFLSYSRLQHRELTFPLNQNDYIPSSINLAELDTFCCQVLRHYVEYHIFWGYILHSHITISNVVDHKVVCDVYAFAGFLRLMFLHISGAYSTIISHLNIGHYLCRVSIHNQRKIFFKFVKPQHVSHAKSAAQSTRPISNAESLTIVV